MRGKVTWIVDGVKGAGITPAHAGKSVLYNLFQIGSWDHPRACGEKKIAPVA